MKPMRDPRRLADEPAMRDLFASATLDDDPVTLDRVAQRLAAAGALTAAASSVSLASSATTSSSAVGSGTAMGTATVASMSAAKITVALLTVTALGTAALVAVRTPGSTSTHEAPQAPATTVLDAPIEPTPPPATEPAEVAAPSPASSPPTREVTASRRRAAEPVAPEQATAPTLAEEIALLAQMRRSVDSDPAQTLRLAAEHRARFGETGRFGHDRDRYETLAREALAGTE